MNRIWTLVASLEVMTFVALASTEDSSSAVLFLISAPEVLHAGTKTSLAVTVFGDFPGKLTAEVAHQSSRVSQTQDFQAGFTSVLTLPPLPGFIPQNSPLTLTVKGYRDETLIFTNTTTLRFNLRNVSSFIQTDRMHYEPGNTVLVRIMSVWLDNRPYEGRIDVSALDPSGTVAERWEVTATRGVAVRGLRLSEEALVGQWTITSTVNGVTDKATFTVRHYERPRFHVLIKTPPQILTGDDLLGSVRAVYPSGRPVHGTLVVSVTSDPSVTATVPLSLLTTTIEIYGSVHFSFTEEELWSLPRRRAVHITARVTDSSTGVEVNKMVEVQRMQETFQLSFHNYPSTLKPSLHFLVNINVGRYDRKPLNATDLKHPLTVQITQTTSLIAKEAETLTFPVPEDGNVQIKLILHDQVRALYIWARFQSSEENLTVYANDSPSGAHIQIIPVNNLPAQIGIPFHVDVESTFEITKLHFVVNSKGGTVTTGTRNSSSFSLTPALSWSPEMCVTVYCVLSEGEVISDTVQILINQHSSLSLTWSRDRAQPGQQVSLTLTALESSSWVGVVVLGSHDDSPPQSDLDFKVQAECDLRLLTNTRLKKQQDGPENGKEHQSNGVLEENVLSVQKYWSSWMNSAETFLWLETDTSREMWTSEDIKVPEGVSSLRAFALEMSENLGLLFTPIPQKLDISKEFSLFLDVPKHLTRGEEIVLEVKIINHVEQDVDIIVLIAQSKTFEFVLSRRSNVSVINAQKLTIGSQTSATALFPIRTLTLGEMEITVDAVSAEASESLVRRLTVKPEGIEKFSSQTLFLELEPGKNFSSTSVSFSFPPDVVSGSQRAHVALVGDVLALSINNMDSLVQMPVGCGEQNMIHFAPSAYVLHYLNKSTHGDNEIQRTALSYLKESYRKQMSYQRRDGSFSAFGNRDTSGSTWLTAFVMRCFIQAKPFMELDHTLLNKALAWLLKQQGPDGEFSEAGRVIHPEMHEGINHDSVALTAFVLVALLEDGTFACSGKSAQEAVPPAPVTLAKTYLENKVSSGELGNYSLGLTAYALALAGSPVADVALAELDKRADHIDGVKMWSTCPGSVSHDRKSCSAQIEMVSYVLLALLSRGGFVEGISLMKWLTMQLSPFGGYGTTQDTVVALQALVCYAVYSGADTIDLKFNISAPTSSFTSLFHIDSTNYRVHQNQEMIVKSDLNLNVYMEGKGFAIFQLNVFYNLETQAVSRNLQQVKESFLLDVHLTDDGDHNHMMLSICTKLKDSEVYLSTGMVLVEVGMLSGFILPPGAAVTADLIKKVEKTPDKISLYLDSLTKSPVCIQLPLVRRYRVAHTQDAVVLVYDYYEPTRRATAPYNSPRLHATDSCFFCGTNCDDCLPGITIMAPALQSDSTSSVSCLFLLVSALFTAL